MSDESQSPASTDDAPLLRCEGLVIGHGGVPLLPPIDVELGRGELVLVVGRNGAGKSTWLKTLLGEVAPLSGAVVWRENRPRIAYLPQSSELDPMLPVRSRDIVAWGRLHGWNFLSPFMSREDRDTCAQALVDADAADYGDRAYRVLSGGERQRVMFAKLLASQSELVIVDEPTASMDIEAERATYDRFTAMVRDHGTTVLVVTHTCSIAANAADRAIYFDTGDDVDGANVVVGTPEEIFGLPMFRRHFGELHIEH